MKDKPLSEKKECVAIFGNQFLVYPEKDVKEAVAQLNDDLDWLWQHKDMWNLFNVQELIKRRFGEIGE